MAHGFRRHFSLSCMALLAAAFSARAEMTEDMARQAAQEVRVLVTEGTAVIGDLQPAINARKVKSAEVTPEVLVHQFKARYHKAAGEALDTKAPGVLGEARRAYVNAFTSVVTRSQSTLAKGGQDAFVPAYFRAQVMKEFNEQMQGGVKVYATNRDRELINSDWAVHKVMKGSSLAGEVQALMGKGGLEPIVKRSGGSVMGYYPMKLGASCVSCHAQNGLKQTEGGFGGALVAEIPVR